MTNPPVRLAWTDFVLDLRDFLIDKQVNTPLYIVGGAVRDAYLRGAIKDIDIAVDGDAIQIARQIADWFDGDIFVMDKERGVARVFVDTPDGQVSMDFARFRGDTLDDDLHVLTVDAPLRYPVEEAFWRSQGAKARFNEYWMTI